MRIPPGQTEAAVTAAIDKAINILAPSFVFGHYDLDDIKQHGWIEALKILEKEKYKPELPFENFIYTHLRNRFINLRRDKLRRNDAPCRSCYEGRPCNDGSVCKKFADWAKRNGSKANIMQPLDIAHISDEHERRTHTDSTVVEDAATAELLRLIDDELPVDLRQSYLQMRDGVPLPRTRRLQVEDAIKEILKGSLTCSSVDD